jgi:hypothetical protein
MNAWVSFNLYIATGVLIEGCQSPETSQESRSNLDFLLTALQAIGRTHVVTQAFIAQLKIDLESAGMSSFFGEIDVSHGKHHLHRSRLIYALKQKIVFKQMGPPAINVRNFKSRVFEFSVDMLDQSIFSTGVSSNVNESSETCSTSDMDSVTPPQDPHNTSYLRGVLPTQTMAERLRRATRFSSSSFNHHEKVVNDIPKFFSIPTLVGQYPTQEERESTPLQTQRVGIISTPIEGQHSSFPSTFASQQQFMQSGSNGTNMEQNVGGFNISTATNSMPPDWAFGPIDNSVLPGFAEFEFPRQDGQDINSLLNGAPWDGSTFQA